VTTRARAPVHAAPLGPTQRGLIAALVLAAWMTVPVAVAPAAADALALDDTTAGLDPVRNLEYLEDSRGILTIAEVSEPSRAGAFVPVEQPVPNFGYTDSTYWFRLDLVDSRPPSAGVGRWIIEVGFPLLEHVDLHVVGAPGGAALQRSGSRVPFNERPVRHNAFAFSLNMRPGEARQAYLRVKTATAFRVPIKIWSSEEFLKHVRQSQIGLGVYFGAMFVMLLFNLLIFLALRDESYFYYVLYIFSMSAYTGSLSGMSVEYLWPASTEWASRSAPFFVGLTNLWALQFTRCFLDTRRHVPRVDVSLLVMIGVSVVLVCAALVAEYAVAARLATWTSVASVTAVLTAGAVCAWRGLRIARIFLAAWLVFLVCILSFALMSAGVLPANVLTQHAAFIGAASEVVLLSLALADRINVQRREKERAQQLALQAQARSVASLEKYREIFEHAFEGIFQVTADGRLINANPALARMLGYEEPAHLLAEVDDIWRDLLASPGQPDDIRGLLRGTERIEGLEVDLRHREGGVLAAVVSARKVYDAEGTLSMYEGTLVDVTARRERERAERAQEAAEAVAQARGRFLAVMSHEIRTPMNAILGFTDLALRSAEDVRQKGFLSRIKTSSLLLLGIINDILDFSKIEAGKLGLEAVRFSLDEVVENTAALFSERLRDSGLDWRLRVEQDVPRMLVGDALRLGQVLNNLIGNAVKFTEKGSIELRVRLDRRTSGSATLEFAVADTGIGIAKTAMARLFSPFSQVDESIARRFGGSGLGLSICRSLVELMGGELEVASEPGVGSTFRFTATFGLAGSGTLTAGTSQAADAEAGAIESEPLLEGARILLAEDNALNQDLVVELLASSGACIDVVGNGREAVQSISEKAYDIVLMDVEMPVMDGHRASREIRADGRFGDLPIIAMTAHAMARAKDACLDAGMNDYISKPIDHARLLGLLARWLPAKIARDARPNTNRRQGAIAPPLSASTSLSSRAAVLDSAAAVLRMSRNESLYTRTLSRFVRDYADAPSRLRRLVGQGKTQEALALLHSVKGLAATVGTDAMSAAAEALEAVLGTGERSPALALDAFERETAAAADAARIWCADHADAALAVRPAGGVPVASGTLYERLQDLDALLESGAYEARARLATMLPELERVTSEIERDELEACMSNFRYARARELLTRIAMRVRADCDGRVTPGS